MDPRHPPVPSPATHTQSQGSGHSSPADTDYDSECNEKDAYGYAYAAKPSARADRASRSTTGHAHDSVISPFSPHASAPNSPGSSISSAAGRNHASQPDILEAHDRHSHRVSLPPRAHLDPEKAASYDAYEAYDARSQHRAAPDAVVYDKTEYHDQGPEDKAWQLLVCATPCMRSHDQG